ncbi:MAG: helix-turn-helix domain-containing protein [Eubacterium sp.]|nr:helix-turn-helix domain-containing protein [Eubacterium sp.]
MKQKELLVEARRQAGFTQKQMADYFGIPHRTYEDWEGEKRTATDYLVRLMIYKLEVEGLVKGLSAECAMKEDA